MNRHFIKKKLDNELINTPCPFWRAMSRSIYQRTSQTIPSKDDQQARNEQYPFTSLSESVVMHCFTIFHLLIRIFSFHPHVVLGTRSIILGTWYLDPVYLYLNTGLLFQNAISLSPSHETLGRAVPHLLGTWTEARHLCSTHSVCYDANRESRHGSF